MIKLTKIYLVFTIFISFFLKFTNTILSAKCKCNFFIRCLPVKILESEREKNRHMFSLMNFYIIIFQVFFEFFRCKTILAHSSELQKLGNIKQFGFIRLFFCSDTNTPLHYVYNNYLTQTTFIKKFFQEYITLFWGF